MLLMSVLVSGWRCAGSLYIMISWPILVLVTQASIEPRCFKIERSLSLTSMPTVDIPELQKLESAKSQQA